MSDKDKIVAQEPGVADPAVVSKVDAIAAGTVGDLAESLDALSLEELQELLKAETVGRNRSTALSAIQRELERREHVDQASETIEGASKADIGDRASYAKMAGKEVDPVGLERPVLTRDGWVLPRPAAAPQG